MVGLIITVVSNVFSPAKWFNSSIFSNRHDCNSQLFLNQGKRGEMSVIVESATRVAAL